MKDENTVYESTKVQNDATQYQNVEENKGDASVQKDSKPGKEPKKTKMNWKVVSMGGGAGVMLGAAAAFLAANASASEENSAQAESNLEHVTDGEVPVVTSAGDDNMSFAEAFAAAREEVGPGGVFEWHGNIYSTFTAEEWNNMSPEDRAEFGSHFNWSSGAHESATASQSSQHDTIDYTQTTPQEDESDSAPVNEQETPEGTAEGTVEGTAEGTDDSNVNVEGQEGEALAGGQDPIIESTPEQNPAESQVSGGEDVEVAGVDDTGVEPPVDGVPVNDGVDIVEVTPGTTDDAVEHEVEILGVVHDNESNMNIGGMTVDGQEVVLVDVDNDETFDVAATDADNNGQITDNEVVDISGENVTVNDLGGFTPTDDSLLAANDDTLDYTNDANVYDI